MFKRFRRNRLHPALREMLQETRLHPSDFIYPVFIKEGLDGRVEIPSLPGVAQLGIEAGLEECRKACDLGVKGIMVFGIPALKDSFGSSAMDEMGIVAQFARAYKNAQLPAVLMADLCFCEYTDHGHCGVLDPITQTVDNDLTLTNLGKQAVVLAQAGIDLIAPSGMMDGMVLAIREALDEAGFSNLPIMSYSTKFASSYYGPFRDVAESAPSFGDRHSYQMNPANRLEALHESLIDEEEGADMLMVKPALAYLDIIREIREETLLPLAVYNVSGEYAMLKAAQAAGVIDYDKVLMETMMAFKRAGADMIISYHALEAATLLDS